MFRGLETFTYGLFRPTMFSICCFSGIAFQASKRSNMGSAVLLSGRSAVFPNYVFKLQNVQFCNESKCKRVYLMIVRLAFSGSKRSDKSSTFLKRDDLLMLR